MRSLFAVMRLELKLFFRDRRALIMILGIPIGIASFIGYLTDDRRRSTDAPRIGVVIADLDHSPLSRRLVEGFQSDAQFDVVTTNADAARALVTNGKYPGALILPPGFGGDLFPGLLDTNRRPVVTVLFDPSHRFEKSLLEGLLLPKIIITVVKELKDPAAARRWVRNGMDQLQKATGLDDDDRARIGQLLSRTDDWLASRTNRSGLPSDSQAVPGTDSFQLPSPVRLVSEAATQNRRAYNGYAHSFPGMALQFILMGMVDFAVNLIRDRETGIFQRLRATPLSRRTLLGGKMLAQSVVALISMVACMAFSMVVFGVRIEGSVTGFLLLLLVVPWMSAGFGLMLAGLGGTPAGTRGLSIALVLLLVMVGGAWFPPFLFPAWLQTVALATPIRWAVEGFDAVTWRGLGLESVLPSIAALSGFAALFSLIGFARFRWRGRRG